jgi:hypothetical protein
MALCLQRSHTRGAIFDSPEFANSIGTFLGRRLDVDYVAEAVQVSRAIGVHAKSQTSETVCFTPRVMPHHKAR